MWFKAYHKFDHSRSMDESNYLAKIDPETCIGCGLCVKRCPMETIHLEVSAKTTNKKGKVAALEPANCIGCGVCAFKCPSKSIVLERRQTITEPPSSIKEFAEQWRKKDMPKQV